MHKTNTVLLAFLFNFIFFIAGLLILAHFPVGVLRSWIHGFGFKGIIIYIVLYFFLFIIPFNPIPKNVITYFALISFGPFTSLIATLFSDLLAVLFNYFIAYHYYTFFPASLKKTLHTINKVSLWALLIARVIPITEGFVGTDFPSYVAGVIKMPLQSFMLATFIPWIAIDTIYFFGLNQFIGNEKYLMLVFIIIIGFSSLQIFLKLRKRGKL